MTDPSTALLSEAEEALTAWSIAYEKKSDGTLFVPGDLDLSYKSLTRLPDLSAVAVGGYFTCAHNKLTSLAGSPQNVGGGFYCFANELTDLKGAPRIVGGEFNCTDNHLVSLEGAPEAIGGGFFCQSNENLASLEYAPLNAKSIVAGFGFFSSWPEVPTRLAPETKARWAQKKTDEFEQAVREVITASAPIALRQPFRFKPSVA